jgi:hypothetical protein
MNLITKHLDKNNLHHAYLLEGARDEITGEILKFCESINIKTSGNPDFYHIAIDNFKIDEALDLRAMSTNKSFSTGKKIFLLCVNTFSLDAENVLLKMFEEPIENTHFFLIVPDVNSLLKTLISRFYLISPIPGIGEEAKEAEKFINMPLKNRIDFIKELLVAPEAPTPERIGVPTFDESQNIGKDGTRAKALKFLNALESVLHKKVSKGTFDTGVFEHIFKVREFLRMPGSSTKTLMESVALVIPERIS